MTFNGFENNETKTRTAKPRESHKGHSIVLFKTQRIGSSFNFRHTIVCECGTKMSNKALSSMAPASLGYRHDAHVKAEVVA